MMKRKSKQERFSSREESYLEDEARRQFSRVNGGLCWPGGAYPGALVVLAESRKKDPALGATTFTVLRTATALTLRDLLRKAKEFEAKDRCELFYADAEDVPMVDAFRRIGGRVTLRQTPHADDFRFLIQRVQEMTGPRAKRLFLGGNFELVGELKALDADAVSSRKEYPLARALGYVQAGMLAYRHLPNEDREAAAAVEAFYGSCPE